METILKLFCCTSFNSDSENQDMDKKISVDYGFMNNIPMPLYIKKNINGNDPNEELSNIKRY